jgi:hypothetical protein
VPSERKKVDDNPPNKKPDGSTKSKAKGSVSAPAAGQKWQGKAPSERGTPYLRHSTEQPQSVKTEREIARERLLTAGILATNLGIPSGVQAASEEELERLGQLPEGARGSEELVNEDRGNY